ncbi:MAG: tripartite tricarboxylate transporter substrate-binding protein [Beijerinckiaceae bacterium]|nr:tripartite tricarboxylate transporter substrate-binding protein [Beijerinckiaceae bacterium]
MKSTLTRRSAAVVAVGATLCLATASARADAVADFYKGKTLNVLIGVGVGGEYDLHARTVARFLGKHIPGNPSVVPQNMTGAGGLKMANYLYDVAARDGTYIGMLAATFPAMQAAGVKGVTFDANKFFWIGSICPTVETMTVWKTTGVKSIEDARKKEVVVGATGRGAITYMFPAMLNEFAGTKFKIVTGYPGGNDVNLAMERGEVGGRNNTWSSWKVTKPEWVKNKDISILVQAGPKAKDLPDVPSIEDVIQNADDRKVVELLVSGTRLGRPLATAPGVPEDRVKALRAAFDAVMKDPEFLKEAEAARIEVDPVRGEDMQKIVKSVLDTPKHLAEKARALIE